MCYASSATAFSVALALIASLIPFYTNAQFAFGITGSLEYLENPIRRSTSLDSDVLSLLSIDASLARETQRVVTSLNYRASGTDYRNNTLQDREILEGIGLVIWKVTPDYLQWNIQNSRSNELISASDPDNADNRQLINRSSTGPRLNLPIGAANFLSLQLDSSEVNYEVTGFLDQVRNSANADFSRIVSRNLRVSLRSSLTETGFDSDLVPEYDFFSYSVVGNFANDSFETSIETGTYKSKSAGSGSASNPLLKLSATYKINSSSQLSANLFKTIEDLLSDLRATESTTGSGIAQDPATGLDSRFGSSNTPGLYVKKTVSAAYSYTNNSRFNLSLDYTNDERTYESRNQQELDERMSLSLLVPLNPRLNFSLTARYSELSFSDIDSLQKLTEIGASVFYRLNDQLSLNFSLRNTDQKSNSILTSYDGVSSYFGISYRR